MKFRPLHDRVVLKRVEEDTKTKGCCFSARTEPTGCLISTEN